MQSEVEGATGITDAAEGRQRECAQKVAELERQINDFGRERERRLGELEKRIKGRRLEAAAALKDLKVRDYEDRIWGTRNREGVVTKRLHCSLPCTPQPSHSAPM